MLSGGQVPFAAHRPEHLRLFVYSYLPQAALHPAQRLAASTQEFGLRPWDQATYRGRPLDLRTLDLRTLDLRTLDTPALSPAGQIPHLFERVSLALPLPGCAGHGPWTCSRLQTIPWDRRTP